MSQLVPILGLELHNSEMQLQELVNLVILLVPLVMEELPMTV